MAIVSHDAAHDGTLQKPGPGMGCGTSAAAGAIVAFFKLCRCFSRYVGFKRKGFWQSCWHPLSVSNKCASKKTEIAKKLKKIYKFYIVLGHCRLAQSLKMEPT